MSNVPKLRFKEFSEEWKYKSIGSIGTFFSGGTPTSSNKSYYDGNIPFIGSGRIGSNEVELFITEEALNSSSAKMVEVGDLLYALYGATSGEVAISKINGAINQAILCIRTNENKIFLKTWLEKNKVNILSTYLQGGQGNLSAQIVKSLKLNLPSKQEQEKIASFLTSVDTKIEQLTKKKELLSSYKKGVMQKIFSGEIRFKADDGSEFCEWEEKKIEEVTQCLDNKRKPLNESERNQMKGNIPYYGANGIVDYVNGYLFEEPLVLLAEDGGNFFEFNTKPIAQKIDGKTWVNNHAHILKAKENALITDFLFYSLVHKDITKYIVGGSRAKLNKSDLLSIKIGLPCLEEQTKIANFLSSIDSKIEQVQRQLNSTKEFKKALLQQMFV